MKKKTSRLVALVLLATPCYVWAVERGTEYSVTASVEMPRSQAELLAFIKELPQLKEFTTNDFNHRVSELTTAPDVKVAPTAPEGHHGFGITVPRVAPVNQVDRYTLSTISNLKGGGTPVGGSQFWAVYGADARKLGYGQIADALDALKNMSSMEEKKYELRQLRNPEPNRMDAGFFCKIYKMSTEQAQNLLNILSEIPKINGVATTGNDLIALSQMTLEEARTWYERTYAEKLEKYTSEIKGYEAMILTFVNQNSGQ